jgi:TatD DNase family protein
MIPYTDTHCHLDFKNFDPDREQVLKRAWKAGVTWILIPGIDLDTNQSAIALAQTYPDKINAAVGVHPNFGKPWSPNILPSLREQAKQDGVVAIGEIGLDYYREHTPFTQQRRMLSEQLGLATDFNLPVIIHNRDSTDDLLATLMDWHKDLKASNNPLAERPGVFHSYSGDLETAKIAIEMNFYIGISGPVTFKNAPEQKSLVKNLPLDHILLETDAPFLTPHPHRGKRNESAYIPLIAEEIARLHGVSPKEIADITYANAMRLFLPQRE